MVTEKFRILPVPPFRLDYTVWILRRRKNNLIDVQDKEVYTRIFQIDNKVVKTLITQKGSVDKPILEVEVICKQNVYNLNVKIRGILKKMLNTQKDYSGFYQMAVNDKVLKALAERFRGLKPPRFPGLFEAIVNAIACQQVSLDVGVILLSRFAEKYGSRFNEVFPQSYSFPEPVSIREVTEQDLRKLGFSISKSRSIIMIAKAFRQNILTDRRFEHMQNSQAVKRLTSMKGIGRWSAEYVLLRGLGRIDVLPGDDAGVRKNIRRLFNLSAESDYETVHRLVSRWQPYAGFVYLHLLLDKLAFKKLI